MKRGPLQCWLDVVTGSADGARLSLGLLRLPGGAATIGVVAVACITNHRGNGFFIFRPGEGWEYVLTLAIAGFAIAVIGPGEWSLDDAFDLTDDLVGMTGLLTALIAGVGGAVALLAVAWRPPPPKPDACAPAPRRWCSRRGGGR